MIFWQINGIFSSKKAKTEKLFAVYHLKKEPAYCLKNNAEVTLFKPNESDFNYHLRSHFVSFNYPYITYKPFNYVQIKDKNILILSKNTFWPQVDPKKVSTIVVSQNFKLRENDLEAFDNVKLVITDGTNNKYVTNQLAKLCSKFGIEFYDTKSKGAYILNL
jgi:spore germination protein YaaH